LVGNLQREKPNMDKILAKLLLDYVTDRKYRINLNKWHSINEDEVQREKGEFISKYGDGDLEHFEPDSSNFEFSAFPKSQNCGQIEEYKNSADEYDFRIRLTKFNDLFYCDFFLDCMLNKCSKQSCFKLELNKLDLAIKESKNDCTATEKALLLYSPWPLGGESNQIEATTFVLNAVSKNLLKRQLKVDMICQKCMKELREGDLIAHTLEKPNRYYHKDCCDFAFFRR
jgi:hypothetical protein